MPIKLHNRNILDQTKGSLIITIDGIGQGHEGMLGRSFAKLYPDEWNKITSKVKYPIPFGQIFTVPTESCSCFENIVLTSLLNHTNEISETVMRSAVKEVVRQALTKTIEMNASTLSSILLKGGWRLPTDLALMAMLDGYESMLPASKKITFEIYQTDTATYQQMLNLCDSLGWDV